MYNGISNAGRVTSYELLHDSKLRPGQDPDIWLYTTDGARDRLREHGEVITNQHLADRILKGLPDEYEYVRAQLQLQSDRLRAGGRQADIYSDKLAGSSWLGNSVVGRKIAMYVQSDSSWAPCFKRSERGH